MKTHLSHHSFQVHSFNSVVHLAHVKLYGHKCFLPFLSLIDIMHGFKGYKHVINNKSTRDKSALRLINHCSQHSFQSISKNLIGQIIHHIAQAYWPEFCNFLGGFHLWAKAYICFIQTTRHPARIKRRKNTIDHFWPNNIPIVFKEDW